jgi:DNA repair exonuclease SbcCD ATPase subunit
MRNLLLLLILLAGGLAGYLIGDYRGEQARKALQEAVDKGNLALAEQQKTALQLETQLRDIGETHQQELEKIRTNYDAKSAEWQREKARLNERIGRLTAERSTNAARLQALNEQLKNSSGSEKERLQREIELLRIRQIELSQQIEGNACLGVRVPQSVHDALSLKMTNAIGGTQ